MINLCRRFYVQCRSDRFLADVAAALQPYVAHCLAAFGPDRCMFASNFPMDKVSLGFEQLYDGYRKLVESRSEADQRALFHDNAQRIYSLP